MVVRVVGATDDDGRRTADVHPGEFSGNTERTPLGDVSSWLRDLVWLLGPVAPPIGIRSSSTVVVTAEPGTWTLVSVRVTNRQAASTSIAIEPSPLRTDDGVEWFPEVAARSGSTVRAFEERTVQITLIVPHDLPPGTYRGSIVVLGLTGDDPDLVVEVVGPDAAGGPTP